MEYNLSELTARVQFLEQIINLHFGLQYGVPALPSTSIAPPTAPSHVAIGERQIQHNPARTEQGMGPILNTNSEFL
jgi:hypothetical protein